MKLTQTRVWIDARNERLDPDLHSEVTYTIKDLEISKTKLKLMEAVYPLVKEVILLSNPINTVRISFNPSYISVSFIDYLLQKQGLQYERRDG
jgi:hypothetical protein